MRRLHAPVLPLLLLLPGLASAGPDPTRLMQDAEDRHRVTLMRSEVEMILQEQGGAARSRKLELLVAQAKGRDDKSRLVFRAPADVQGLTLLSLQGADPGSDAQWVYLPAFRKTRQVANSELGDRFANSDLSYEDLKKREVEDFAYALVGEDKIDGRACWVIEAKAAGALAKDYPYGKRQIWLFKDTLFPVRIRYFGLDSAPLKELNSAKLVKVKDQAYRADEVTIVDVRRKHRTVLKTLRRQVEPAVGENTFSRHALGGP